jgi:hypothetical protein
MCEGAVLLDFFPGKQGVSHNGTERSPRGHARAHSCTRLRCRTALLDATQTMSVAWLSMDEKAAQNEAPTGHELPAGARVQLTRLEQALSNHRSWHRQHSGDRSGHRW